MGLLLSFVAALLDSGDPKRPSSLVRPFPRSLPLPFRTFSLLARSPVFFEALPFRGVTSSSFATSSASELLVHEDDESESEDCEEDCEEEEEEDCDDEL
jgi:hypothetical protein